MNSPPEALSPSSTPSSGSPSPDEVSLPPPFTSTTGGSSAAHALASASPSQQAKRRLPASSSSLFAGRENKSRRRDRDDRDVREDRMKKSSLSWEPQARGDMQGLGHAGATARVREELVDVHMVEYVRNTYGDPFDDTSLKERNKAS